MKAITSKASNSTTYASAYSIVLERAEDDDGIWTAEVPAFGIVTEGRGRAGARRAAYKALIGYIEVATSMGRPVPDGDLMEIRAVVPQRKLVSAQIGEALRKTSAPRTSASRKTSSASGKSQRQKVSSRKQLEKKTTRR